MQVDADQRLSSHEITIRYVITVECHIQDGVDFIADDMHGEHAYIIGKE
jgi:hypothetical protein